MTHLNTEIQLLKKDTDQMFDLVIKQLTKSREALIRFDKDLAIDVDINEKRVNAFELRLDTKCEKILALFNPVAVDLRFVLAVLKINYNLERIGDYACGIALIVKDAAKPFDKELLEKTKILEMFDCAFEVLHETQNSFVNENPKLARNAFQKDKLLDEINNEVNSIISKLIIGKTEKQIVNSLDILTVIRKLERVGDQTKNIAEEIIFYIEAKVLKHKLIKSTVAN
jgi:phosphate transport system protein